MIKLCLNVLGVDLMVEGIKREGIGRRGEGEFQFQLQLQK